MEENESVATEPTDLDGDLLKEAGEAYLAEGVISLREVIHQQGIGVYASSAEDMVIAIPVGNDQLVWTELNLRQRQSLAAFLKLSPEKITEVTTALEAAHPDDIIVPARWREDTDLPVPYSIKYPADPGDALWEDTDEVPAPDQEAWLQAVRDHN